MNKYLLLLVFTIYTDSSTISPINLKQSQQKCQTSSHEACHDLGYHYNHKGDQSSKEKQLETNKIQDGDIIKI